MVFSISLVPDFSIFWYSVRFLLMSLKFPGTPDRMVCACDRDALILFREPSSFGASSSFIDDFTSEI